MNRGTHIVLKYTLLLFVGYCINISFFTHTHVVNGVTIVHSHFYKGATDNKSQPTHGHSSSEIQLISAISHFVSTGEAPEQYVVDNSARQVHSTALPQNATVPSAQFEAEHHLRAPPQLLA